MKLSKKIIGLFLSLLFIVGCSSQQNDDVSGEITVVTNRSDANELFAQMEKDFIAKYPKVTKVNFENIAEYDSTMMTRINSGDYGDVLFIPFSMAGNREQYPNYFESLGSVDELKKVNLDVSEADYDGQVYGLPAAINSLGIIYNERVMEEAGIKNVPKTTDEFLANLKLIKEKTGAIPFYSNYNAVAVWAGALTSFGGEQFKSNTLASGDAFAKGQPVREVMDLMYTMASNGLIEKDPLTLNSQAAMTKLAKGEIAMLMNGSQEVAGIQAQGKDKIKIMNFPVTKNDKTSLAIGAPAVVGVNKNSKNIPTAKVFLNFFISKESDYAKNLNGMPSNIADLNEDEKKLIDESNVILTVASEDAKTNEKYAKITDEVGISRLSDVLQQVINIGLYPEKNISYDDYVKQLSDKWKKAAQNNE